MSRLLLDTHAFLWWLSDDADKRFKGPVGNILKAGSQDRGSGSGTAMVAMAYKCCFMSAWECYNSRPGRPDTITNTIKSVHFSEHRFTATVVSAAILFVGASTSLFSFRVR